MIKKIGWLLLVILGTLPLLGLGSYPMHLLIVALLWSYIYTSWSIMGRLGLVSFGHGAFLGIGAPMPYATVPLLIPGVGAQGGDAVATVRAGLRREGERVTGPIVVNSSRAILYASSGDDFAAAARREAERTRGLLNEAAAG